VIDSTALQVTLRVTRVLDGLGDVDYLRRWAQSLGVADLLERALGERNNP